MNRYLTSTIFRKTIASLSGLFLIVFLLGHLVGNLQLFIPGEIGKTQFNKYGAMAVLFAGITPFPYKIITISSGIAGMSFYQFLIFSVIARGARFFIIAILLRLYGETIRNFIERHLNLLFILFVILLIAGFLLIKVI